MGTRPIETPISIGSVIQHAVVFNFKRWQENSVTDNDLLQTVERLFALLEARQIDYLLVGGIALLQYIEGRNTEDIDLLLAVSALQKLPEIHLISQDRNFARGMFEQLQIDLLLTRNPLFAKVQRHYATTQRFAERAIPCATVEGLLLLKLYALPSLYRQANFARVGLYENDIATLMQSYKPDMEPLFVELAADLSPTDLAAVRDIVAEIQQRIARFEQSRASNP